ncbi:MAG: putative quinol monooxygenase [Rhodospirillaceae bacterium]
MAGTKFAIFVTVKCKPGTGKDFMPIIMENAVAARRDEPNCHEFRVMTAEGDPDTFHFFEIYTDASWLDVHREQPHFKKYVEKATPMMAERAIQPLTVHI